VAQQFGAAHIKNETAKPGAGWRSRTSG